MKVTLIESPTQEDWLGVKQRALVTVGLKAKTMPTVRWQDEILAARHSPIRYLRFSFYLEEIPSWVATHLARHGHAQPYIRSQRNDRQNEYDRNKAPQDTPVDMIWDVNGEEMLVIANKRLCKQASEETRAVVAECCRLVINAQPVFKRHLVPMCVYHGGVCHEMHPCDERSKKNE